MVGTRRSLLRAGSNDGNSNGDNLGKYKRIDLESGYGTINASQLSRQKFRNAIHQTMHDGRAAEMKKKLIDSVDHDALEMYRKSDESVRCSSLNPGKATTDNIAVEMHQQQAGSTILRGTEQSYRRLAGS